ncbi:MAG: DMT family transporter [Deltaproteobacteria bacterium]|nr:DMT family transporter [Deltaproteobacteria bacterium]
MTNQNKAYIFGLATVLLWSTVASAFKISLRYLSPAGLLFYASLFSTLVLGAVVVARGRVKEIVSSTSREWRHSLLLGLLNPFLYYLVLFKAYDLLPAQQAQPINYTWALTLALLSVPLLGQRIGLGDITGLLLGYSGVVVISTQGQLLELNFSSPFGVFLALVSTIIWALYWIYNTRDSRSPVVALFMSFACGSIFITIYSLAVGDLHPPPWPGLLGAGYVGAFEMSITFILWLSALRLSENTAKVSTLIFLSPPLSLIFIHFFVGETITAATISGLGLILLGLVVQKQLNSRVKRIKKPG